MQSTLLKDFLAFLSFYSKQDPKARHLLSMYNVGEIKFRLALHKGILSVYFYRVGTSIYFTFYEIALQSLPKPIQRALRELQSYVYFLQTGQDKTNYFNELEGLVEIVLPLPKVNWQVVSEGYLLLENFSEEREEVQYFKLPLL